MRIIVQGRFRHDDIDRATYAELARGIAREILPDAFVGCTIVIRVQARSTIRRRTIRPGRGQVVSGYAKMKDRRHVLIALLRGQAFASLFTTLAHELVHAAQYLTGRLVWPGEGRVSWEGRLYEKHERPSYADAAWENEARAAEPAALAYYHRLVAIADRAEAVDLAARETENV